MNEKITLKNKSFTKMFSFLVVLIMVAFCSSSALAQIQVRLNLTPDRVYNGSQYGGLDWKNPSAKLVDASTGAEISVALCDVTGFDPQADVACRFSDKNAGKNKSCEITDLSPFSTAVLTDPVAYELVPITGYTPVAYSKLSYDPVGAKLVSTKGEITHKFLTASYSVPTLLQRQYNGSILLDGSSIEKSSISLTGYILGESGCYVSEITNVYAPSKNVGLYNTPGNQATVNGITLAGPFDVAFNYKVTSFNVNARILPKPITVNEDAIIISDHQFDETNIATIDWTSTSTDPTVLFFGVYDGDAIDFDRTLGTALFSDPAVGTLKNVSISGLVLTNIGTFPTDNYILTPNTALSHGNITKANLDPTLALTALPVVYGTKLDAIVGTTITPAPLGFDYRIEWLYNGLDNNNYQPLVSESGSPLIQVRLTKLVGLFPSSDDLNYNPIIVPANITVNPKVISVDLIGADNKVYDGTDAAIVNATGATYNLSPDLLDVLITRNGVLDDLTIDYSALTGTFVDVNVGTGKTVNIIGSPVESGLSKTNYTITYNSSTTANITKAPFITMKLKNTVNFSPIDFPANFSSTPLLSDFDFTGFIGTDEASFGANFVAEDFRYRLTDNSANYISILSPQPGTYNVVVTKAADSPALLDNSTITLLDPTNLAIIANYEGIQFSTTDKTQLVNITPASVIFPAQTITEYGWTLKEIYNSVDALGVQIIDAAANLDPTKIRAQAGPLFIEGVFEWVLPNSIPNVTATPGEAVDYIFTPDAALYGTAYGVTITGTHHVLLNKAQLAITTPPSTQTILVGQTVGDATITAPSGEVIHKNKLSTVYSTTVNPLIGDWSYINPAEVVASTGAFSKDIKFTLTDVDFLRNYISPVLLTDLGATAKATVNVSPSINNFNPDGVHYEFVYGTKISDPAAAPIIDPAVFVIPGKELAYPGTFTFITDDATLTPMDVNTIPYRTFAADTTLWVLYTPGDASYAPEAFLAKVKVTPKTLYYDVTYTKVYDGSPSITISTTNADLNPAGQIVDRAGVFDVISFDQVTFDLDSKNVNIYNQTNILPATLTATLTGADSYNYELAPMPTLANVSITPASLIVNIDNVSISVREVLPTFNVNWTGFVGGEDFSTAITDNGQPLFVTYTIPPVTIHTGDLAPTSGVNWIQIPVAKYTPNNGNYVITYPVYVPAPIGTELNNILTVTPAQIKIFAQDRHRVYGEITNPVYFFDRYPYGVNPLYYDFDVYEYTSATDSVLIDEVEKAAMFFQAPSITCQDNTIDRPTGKYVISLASNSQLNSDLYFNDKYEILDHVNGVLTIHKATPKILTLPTTLASTFGTQLSDIALAGGSATHPYVYSQLATTGHFEWDLPANFVPVAGNANYKVKYVVDDSRNYNNAINNNQYNDSTLGYFNWTPVANDSTLAGANFEVNVTINKVAPHVNWPTSSILYFGQTLADATLNNGSTNNPVDVNPTFTWTLVNPATEYPNAGMTMYEVLYTPSNPNFLGLTNFIPVYTNKTTPALNGSATVASYEFGQTLSTNPIVASFINTHNNVVVNGTIDWVNGTLTPVDGLVYTARFTPTDDANYNSKLIDIQVQVTPATPIVSNWPAVSNLVYGQKIEDASISGGLAVNPNNSSTAINGTFVWATPSTLAVTGTNSYLMNFIPTDPTKYLPTSALISIYTEKATPVVTANLIATTAYGHTLAQRGLTLNSAINTVSHISSTETLLVDGTIDWNAPATTPTVNQDTYRATFTPTLSGDYNSVELYINVITTKADPVMNPYSVSSYNNGQKLNAKAITLSAIPAYNAINNLSIAGNITWNSPDVTPENGNSYLATFRPEDQINYNTQIVSIPVVVLPKKASVSWPTVSTLTYGQILNDAIVTGGSAVNPNNVSTAVAGTFLWETPNALPVVGEAYYNMIFKPSDNSLLSDTSSIRIITAKATPTIILDPVASDVYGLTLADRLLTINSSTNVVTHRLLAQEILPVAGTITWNNPLAIPTVANNEYKATFTPTDIANYNSVVINVTNVPTTKATPIVAATVAPYSYGQELTAKTPLLSSAVNPVNNSLVLAGGQFVWDIIHDLPITGTYGATYYPTDMDNYTTAPVSISVTVNASSPLVTWPSVTSLVYGQTLSDVELTNAVVKNANNEGILVAGKFEWVAPTTVPVAGTTTNVLQFIPDNTNNYNVVVNNNVTIYTAKVSPEVTLNAVATDTYGKTLANRPLTVNSATNVVSHRSSVETLPVAGIITWNNPTAMPTTTNSNYLATFTPTDIANYNAVIIDVNVPTSKATPVVNGAAVAAYTYGQALPANTITTTSIVNPNNSALSLAGGTIVWKSIDALPVTGTNVHVATFTPAASDLANYNSVDFNVNVTVNKAAPVVTWPIPTEIIYGQTLAQVSLTGPQFAVNTINNAEVPGTFVWASATTVTPSNPATSYRLRFIPTDLANYYSDSTMINLVVNKSNPNVNWGTRANITYGEALSDIVITNQVAENPITGANVAGAFAWNNPTIEPNVNNAGFVRTFVPTDLNNYIPSETIIVPVVNKANPVLTQTANPFIITYGQQLPAITATAVNPNNNASVSGSYEWNNTPIHLPQAGVSTPYHVEFTPTGIDAENYNTVISAFNVQVNKAKPVLVAPIASSLVYEQTLAESTLTQGSAMNANSYDAVAGEFVWTLSTTIPDAGSLTYPAIFIPQDKNNYDNSNPIGVVVEVAKKHLDIEIYNLEHIFDGNQKEASFRDAAGNVDLTGMIDAKYYKGNTNVLISTIAPIDAGTYRVIATIIPTSNYVGRDTAMLVINKNAANMTNPEEQIEIVNAIIPGKNQYFKIRDCEQMTPVTVRMVNANGNNVYQSDNYKNNFDMSNLPRGTYFYAITFKINGSEYNKTGRVEVVGK
ncbi:MAG: YDG domain-containing protein [Bacteroidales bacterium]|nr:YDG domain-containing protein [Bacteroidales bacterium]